MLKLDWMRKYWQKNKNFPITWSNEQQESECRAIELCQGKFSYLPYWDRASKLADNNQSIYVARNKKLFTQLLCILTSKNVPKIEKAQLLEFWTDIVIIGPTIAL